MLSPMADPKYMTVDEVAVIFRRGRATVTAWCRTGKIEAIHLPGGGWLIPQAVIEKIMEPAVQSATKEPQ